jgi:hypothetical protein
MPQILVMMDSQPSSELYKKTIRSLLKILANCVPDAAALEVPLSVAALKNALVLFWALWLSVVVATNICDGLKEIKLLGDSWLFASENFRFIVNTTDRYDVPMWFNWLLFVGVIVWEGGAAALFWQGWRDMHYQEQCASRRLYTAFFVSLMLWAAFMLVDEIFIAYANEAVHARLFTAQLVTLLAIVLLPETGSPTHTDSSAAPSQSE